MLYVGRYWLLVYSLLFVAVWLLDLCLVVLIVLYWWFGFTVGFVRYLRGGSWCAAASSLWFGWFGLVGFGGWLVLGCVVNGFAGRFVLMVVLIVALFVDVSGWATGLCVLTWYRSLWIFDGYCVVYYGWVVVSAIGSGLICWFWIFLFLVDLCKGVATTHWFSVVVFFWVGLRWGLLCGWLVAGWVIWIMLRSDYVRDTRGLYGLVVVWLLELWFAVWVGFVVYAF